MAPDDVMHIVQVFPDRAQCSCGNVQSAVAGGEARRKAEFHAETNTPSVIIDRRKCSVKCLENISSRNIRISFHDEDCPQGERNHNG